MGVDIVLTAYKRPEVLLQQIEAIKRQTYKIDNIFLFQDCINSYYRIVFDDTILERFNDVYVAENNEGVWGRFRYANRISNNEYICIFDDDTIPGKKWIENCVKEFSNVEGIYGTNGIIVKSPDKYPYDMAHVGWHKPNKKTIQVDFVGHSWFLKKAWLGYMLKKNEQYNYKYVGEDMALSFACQEIGVDTFVPPHPYEDIEKWGSIPCFGDSYGRKECGISISENNLAMMNQAIVNMAKGGWVFISDRDNDYLQRINNDLEAEPECFFLQQIKNKAKGKKVYLYGAGCYGEILYRKLSREGIDVAGFIETNRSSYTKKIDGKSIEIKEPNEVIEKSSLVVLALAQRHHDEVRQKFSNNTDVLPSESIGFSYDELFESMKLTV